jgi:hypothetical protein
VGRPAFQAHGDAAAVHLLVVRIYFAGSQVRKTQRVLKERGARRLISYGDQGAGNLVKFFTTPLPPRSDESRDEREETR